MDQCNQHNDCFARLHTKIEDFDTKQDKRFDELKDIMHKYDLDLLNIANKVNVMESNVENRLSQIEKEVSNIKESTAQKSNKVFDIVKSIMVPLIVAAVIAMAGVMLNSNDEKIAAQMKSIQDIEKTLLGKIDSLNQGK